jgi:hypothetical protein
MADQERLADDLLRGVPAIADFIGESPRQTYDLLEAGRVPGFKLGAAGFGTPARPS